MCDVVGTLYLCVGFVFACYTTLRNAWKISRSAMWPPFGTREWMIGLMRVSILVTVVLISFILELLFWPLGMYILLTGDHDGHNPG